MELSRLAVLSSLRADPPATRADPRSEPPLPEEWLAYLVPTACSKPLAGGRFVLELHRQDRVWKPRLRDRQSGAERELEVEQAEIDPSGRLILVREGKLFAATVGKDLTLTEQELADFNDMRFKAIPPPDWATQWP